MVIFYKGTFRTNAAGTIVPYCNFSVRLMPFFAPMLQGRFAANVSSANTKLVQVRGGQKRAKNVVLLLSKRDILIAGECFPMVR